VIVLDAPVAFPVAASHTAPRPDGDAEPNVPVPPAPELLDALDALDALLDQDIGTPVANDVASRIVQLASDDTTPPPAAAPDTAPNAFAMSLERGIGDDDEPQVGPEDLEPTFEDEPGNAPASSTMMGPKASPPPAHAPPEPLAGLPAEEAPADSPPVEPITVIVVESDIETLVESSADAFVGDVAREPDEQLDDEETDDAPDAGAGPESHGSPTSARRRTPTSVPVRHAAASIPRTTAPGGRSLPRAYVAKRRTPPAGVTVVTRTGAPPISPAPPVVAPPPNTAAPTGNGAGTSLVRDSLPPGRAATFGPSETSASSASSEPTATATLPSSDGTAARHEPVRRPERPRADEDRDGSRQPGDRGPLVVFLVTALVGLAVFVLLTLR
jgi:hypothetical protein